MISRYMRVMCLCMLTTLSGCTLIYKGAGKTAIAYAEDIALPFVLRMDDPQMGCTLSESLAPVVFSFGEVTKPPDRLAILFYLMSASCAESKAWEAHLHHLRALQREEVLEAQDARIVQKRYLTLAARRQLASYNSMVLTLGEPGDTCPKFDNEEEGFYWLVGLLAGLQAIFSDLSNEGQVGVPLNIAGKVVSGATCLDNDRWWGVPQAMQAAVGSFKPVADLGSGVDVHSVISEASRLGEAKRVRLAHVLEAYVYLGLGDDERLKEVIRRHADVVSSVPADERFKMLDVIATVQLQAISDRLWTQAVGKRTPVGGLGSFWDDPVPEVDAVSIDDLL